MVSLQSALCSKERGECPTNRSGDNSSSKKRKWEDGEELDNLKAGLFKELKLWKDDDTEVAHTQPISSNVHLHLEAPLPREWQRCLDIKSGEINFYNSRTQKRTSGDPRESTAEDTPLTDSRPLSLDLELNLTCKSSPRRHGGAEVGEKRPKKCLADGCSAGAPSHDHKTDSDAATSLCKMPSWVTYDAEPNREMVTAVCGRCHMLVMMCKSSPSCPNCKFSQSLEQKPSTALLKSGAQTLVRGLEMLLS